MAESRGVGENFLPTGPSVILSIPRSHLFPLLQTAPQSAEDPQPALSDSLQHWPAPHPSSPLCTAPCLSLRVGKCSETHRRSPEVRGPLGSWPPMGTQARRGLGLF